MKKTLLIITVLCAFAGLINAQQENEENFILDHKMILGYWDSLDENVYLPLLDSVKLGLSEDFLTLRLAYTKTKEYQPYDTMEKDYQSGCVAKIKLGEFAEAAKIIDSLLEKNYVDMYSHFLKSYALSELKDTAKAIFHMGIYEGLIKSILISGDGMTPKTAMLVIDTSEEYTLLNAYDMTFKGQSLISDEEFKYDKLQVVNPSSEKEMDLYFNIDILMHHLSKSFER